MRRAPTLTLTEEQRASLERWSRGGSTPYRLVIRAQIVLLASYGYTNRRIARLLHTNPITVARWRSRFLLLGIEGIRTEAPRNGSPPPVPEEVVRRIIEKTLNERPPDRTHWSTRSLAREVGVSHTTIRRVWKMHGIRPNRSRVAMLAEGARYRAKNLDLVGVYINPLRRAVAFSVSEGAVVGGGRPPVSGGVRTGSSGSSGRPWLKDLVTTLDLLDRGEPVPTSRRHVDQEFLAFLRTVQGRTAMDQRVMLLAEGIEPALSPPIARWLSRHPKVSAQVRTRSGAWNQNVLEWLQATASPRTGDGAPRNLPKLITAVERWKQGNEGGRRPFAWTPE